MNKRWLARASLFESPKVKRCKRGHDLNAQGVYLTTHIYKPTGKKHTVASCRRCRIEDVQLWRARKELANSRARTFERAA